jgi:hypothetical protein
MYWSEAVLQFSRSQLRDGEREAEMGPGRLGTLQCCEALL